MFLRRFLFDPGNEVLLDIESVNVLDLDPPASISGVGTGTALLVGEFENGAFNVPTEVSGTTDFVNTFGELGYNYGGVRANNPCARSRRADGAVAAEFWNGNGFVQLNAKKFRRLIITRVDTSVGAVTFVREAFITGAAAFAYNLEPNQVLQLDIGSGNASATFTATAATTNSTAGTYPTLFVGGETLTLGYDGAPNFTVTFLAADQTKLQVIARINQYAGFTFATDGGANLITFTAIQRGNGSSVRVVSASAGVLTALGLTAGSFIGTGNVANIDAASFTEVKTVLEAAFASCRVELDSQGRLRFTKGYAAVGDYVIVGAATTATALGFALRAQGTNDGIANYRTTTQVFPVAAATGVLTLGVDDESNVNVTITNGSTQAQVITAINTALGFTSATSVSATIMLLRGRANGGQVRILGSTVAGILTGLGLTVETLDIPPIVAGVIPAGTEVTNTAQTNRFVTMQNVTITAPTGGGPGINAAPYAPNGGPYTVKVRHALDDGTGVSATAGTIVRMLSAPDIGSFQTVNPLQIAAALTESAIDALYSAAIDKTIDLNSVAAETNLIWSARQSNVVRRKLRENVLTASSIGMFGRLAALRTPLGTSKALALSRIAEPGVGAYRNQRVIFCWPQANSFVPLIALRGLSGGLGFTADGNINIGADGFMVSICTQLPPEENPGQETPFAAGVNSVETTGVADGLDITDYTNLKAAGVAGLRIDNGVVVFQSGVTSVDPSIFPNLKNISRRRMADFIQDTLSRRLKGFGKRLSTNARRKAMTSEIRQFMGGLLSVSNPDSQRIAGFSVNDKDGNTTTTLAQGLYRIILRVKTLASLDSIVLESTIGESVVIEELPA
jgi:hypothetical protein